jgi:hypothetical protein
MGYNLNMRATTTTKKNENGWFAMKFRECLLIILKTDFIFSPF